MERKFKNGSNIEEDLTSADLSIRQTRSKVSRLLLSCGLTSLKEEMRARKSLFRFKAVHLQRFNVFTEIFVNETL